MIELMDVGLGFVLMFVFNSNLIVQTIYDYPVYTKEMMEQTATARSLPSIPSHEIIDTRLKTIENDYWTECT